MSQCPNQCRIMNLLKWNLWTCRLIPNSRNQLNILRRIAMIYKNSQICSWTNALLFLVTVTIFLTAGCSEEKPTRKKSVLTKEGRDAWSPRRFVSLMKEGSWPCLRMMMNWLGRVDSNHHSRLQRPESCQLDDAPIYGISLFNQWKSKSSIVYSELCIKFS